MYLERLLAINMATLGAVGALLLGMGQRSLTLPLIVLAAGAVSVWVVDVQRWFRLSRRMVNLLALLAAMMAFWDVVRLRGAFGALLGLADLLLYLQIILSFQQKDARVYWQLAILSLFEAVVAAAFNQSVFFGVMLVVYLFTGSLALALFYLHRERCLAARREGVPRPVASAGRWPLAAEEPAFAGAAAGAASGAGIGRELIRRMAGVAAASLALGLLIFFIFPRWGVGAWRGRGGAPRASVGFSERVVLGELGRVIQNPEKVLRIEFADEATGEPYAVLPDVYLRGRVLTEYQGGYWRYRPSAFWHLSGVPVASDRPLPGLVRQKLTIEPMDREELFCVWPFVFLPHQPYLRFDQQQQVLFREPHRHLDRSYYELGTTAFRGVYQARLVPCREMIDPGTLFQMPPQDGPKAVPGLIALARRWAAESGLEPSERYHRALWLERQLQDSGHFQYSLQGCARDLSLDPIEDFITNHPQGHCEYFATALVLMLRSQGIPARLVVGYKTDEYHEVGHFYQVRQLHAHTWVEAFLRPQDVPASWADPERPGLWRRGAWLRLDPTPSATHADVALSLWDRLSWTYSWLDTLWANYVMDMDRPRQREAIYQPSSEWLASAARRMADPAWWRAVLSSAWKALNPGEWTWLSGHWFSWRGGLATIVAGLLGVLAYRGARRAWRWLSRLVAGARGPDRSGRSQVAFYRRLEAVLARWGLVCAAAQTPREFALDAGAKIAAAADQPALAPLPAQVAEAFYAVRFGRQTLDEAQAAAVAQALAELERAAPGVADAPRRMGRQRRA